MLPGFKAANYRKGRNVRLNMQLIEQLTFTL